MNTIEAGISRNITRSIPLNHLQQIEFLEAIERAAFVADATQTPEQRLTAVTSLPNKNGGAKFSFVKRPPERVFPNQHPITADISISRRDYTRPFALHLHDTGEWTTATRPLITSDTLGYLAKVLGDEELNALQDAPDSSTGLFDMVSDRLHRRRTWYGTEIARYATHQALLDESQPDGIGHLREILTLRGHHSPSPQQTKSAAPPLREYSVHSHADIGSAHVEKVLGVRQHRGRELRAYIGYIGALPHLDNLIANADIDQERDTLLQRSSTFIDRAA